MDLGAFGVAALLFILTMWGISKPFWLTFTWTVENCRVNLQVCVDYSAIHRHRSWQLPVKSVLQASPPALPMNWSGHAIDRACWALTVLSRLTQHLFERMQVVRFDLRCRVGLANAAQTALWTAQLAEAASAWIALKISPRAQTTPTFEIEPIWDGSAFLCNFTSIIQLRLSDIILAMISGLVGPSRGGVWYGKLQRRRA
ncbi:MAG: hypothetical protein C7B45_05070 [Sulfobacillus acidophilus]|uniref:DUF2953 domain-containing protein n=1 Tax=Sulfobacillus acidophilus TaxID=53633 RepID=A0A2T2WKR8_9FIRM|nr:MAG: hypothetical protein C7B45_05070 [Sulfobacillus acidophilus]